MDNELTGSFPSGSVTGDVRCVSLSTYSDRTVENTETFLVVLDSFDSVIITSGTAVVNIQDDDGEFLYITWSSSSTYFEFKHE